ncbi:hypothetical protein MYX84_00690 [Acidobacteria bacterium AH-259-O06]|nr:hypothetical protein [Acidobacteria bacterium AH-259-O06]
MKKAHPAKKTLDYLAKKLKGESPASIVLYDGVLNEHSISLESFVQTEEVEAAELKFDEAYQRIAELASDLPEKAEQEVIEQLQEMESGLISVKMLALEEMFNLFVGFVLNFLGISWKGWPFGPDEKEGKKR